MPQNIISQLSSKSTKIRSVFFSLLSCLGLAIILMSISSGPVSIPLSDIIIGSMNTIGLSEVFNGNAIIVETIRIPRTLLGFSVGFALGVSGAALQGLFRNPLVDSSLIGVSTGGALGAATWILLGSEIVFLKTIDSALMTPIFAFFGSIIILTIIYQIGSKSGYISVAVMLLAGIALNAIAGAILGIMIFASDDFQLRAINFWTLGSVGGANLKLHGPAMIVALLSSFFIIREAKQLNLLALGEKEAKYMGCEVDRTKRRLLLLSALATASAVSISGIIGFIGLVAPHLIRISVGSDHRIVLAGSGLLGAILIISADIGARLVVQPAELPLGIMTAIFGGPFFIWLLLKQRQYLA